MFNDGQRQHVFCYVSSWKCTDNNRLKSYETFLRLTTSESSSPMSALVWMPLETCKAITVCMFLQRAVSKLFQLRWLEMRPCSCTRRMCWLNLLPDIPLRRYAWHHSSACNNCGSLLKFVRERDTQENVCRDARVDTARVALNAKRVCGLQSVWDNASKTVRSGRERIISTAAVCVMRGDECFSANHFARFQKRWGKSTLESRGVFMQRGGS